MKIRTFSIIAGIIIIAVTTFFALAVIFTQPGSYVDGPETDVDVAISDDLSITSRILTFVDEGNGSFLISYQYDIVHAGDYPALNLSASSWFNDSLLNTFAVISLTTNSSLTLNPNFNGMDDRDLLSGSNFLAPNSSAQIILTVRLSYQDISRQFINFVETAGDSGLGSSSSTSSRTSSRTSSSGRTSTSASPAPAPSSTSSSTGSGTGSSTTPTSSSTSNSTTTTVSVSTSASSSQGTTSSIGGLGGGDNALYDTDQVSFPLSGLPITTTTSAAPTSVPAFFGKGL